MPEANGGSETQVPVQGAASGEQPPSGIAASSTGAPSTQPSETGTVAQDQPTGPETTPSSQSAAAEIEQEERIRRDVQSRSDRIVAQKLREIEETRAQEEEAKRLASMPAEDFKRTVLQKQVLTQTVQQQAQQQVGTQIFAMCEELLSIVPGEAQRAELRERSMQMQSLGEFAKAIVAASVESQTATLRGSIQTAEREAAQREARADSSGSHQLGTGESVSDLKHLSPTEKISRGIELAQRERR